MAKPNRGGRLGKASGLNPSDIVGTRSLVSERGHNQELVDDTLAVFSYVRDEYGAIVEDIELVTLKGRGKSVLAYYDGSNIAVNESYFSKQMEKAYQECVEQGFHPSSGNKTGLQAVVAHELGHMLTDEIGAKIGKTGIGSINEVATIVVKEARKETKHRGVVQMAKAISGYATYSNAEAIAEAFADVYCNGKKAHSESKAIVNVMNKYLKGVN